MKKVIIFLLVVCSVFFALTSCGVADENQTFAIEEEKTEFERELYGFILLTDTKYWQTSLAYDPESMAMYKVIRDFHSTQYFYEFIPLYNADGTVRQYNPETMETQFE